MSNFNTPQLQENLSAKKSLTFGYSWTMSTTMLATVIENDVPVPLEADDGLSSDQKKWENVDLFDEGMLMPGVNMYTLDEYKSEPYPKFRPQKVPLVSKHSTGIHEGYVYEFYRPQVVRKVGDSNGGITIKYEREFVWNPMTLAHARILAAELNRQMRRAYLSAVKAEKAKKK